MWAFMYHTLILRNPLKRLVIIPPGQFGPPDFSVSVFVGFLIATIISVLDSIGDYYACAKTCNVPPPPNHATNRGIAIEGLCTFLSGIMGCGHATSTYGGNVGAVGITKVKTSFVLIYIRFSSYSN